MYLEMISKIVTPGEFFVTMGAFIVSVSTVLCYMPLPIALYCELEAALIADEGFDTLVRSHVLLQESFPKVCLVA